jgi:hypothetical protein
LWDIVLARLDVPGRIEQRFRRSDVPNPLSRFAAPAGKRSEGRLLVIRLVVAALAVGMALSSVAFAQRKDCEELKTEIEAKIKKNGVEKFSLEIVDAAKEVVEPAKVVGTCDGGSKKIVYTRG